MICKMEKKIQHSFEKQNKKPQEKGLQTVVGTNMSVTHQPNFYFAYYRFVTANVLCFLVTIISEQYVF